MSEYLTTKDLKTVQNLLWKDRVKWYNIGVQLDLYSQLETIRHNFETVEDRFTNVLLEWLRQIQPRPTWQVLISALRSAPVDCKDTAAKIEECYNLETLDYHKESTPQYYDFENLPDYEISSPPVKLLCAPLTKVEKDMLDLDKKFSKMVTDTYDTLIQEKKLTVSFLRSRLNSFPSTRRHEHQEFFDRYVFGMERDTTAEELWSRLCSYWHFINYSLLQFIIDTIGCKILVTDMKHYEVALKQFCEETDLIDFVKCFPKLYRQESPINSQKLEVKINSKHGRLKLAHLNCLEKAFVTTFSLPRICGLILKRITVGCFLISWLVPAHYSKLLRWKLSICAEKFFESHDIHSVSLDGEVCYLKGSERSPINPAQEVASNTTITEEVFELRNMMGRVMMSSPPFTMTQLCTAYVSKMLTQHFSHHPVHGTVCISSTTKLPQEVQKKFSKLCQEAYKMTLQDLDGLGMAGALPATIDGLGLALRKLKGSHQVFVHKTLQEYLAAVHIAASSNPIEIIEQVAVKCEQFANRAYLFYFVAGLASHKNLICETLLSRFYHLVNRHVLFFEVSDPSITALHLTHYAESDSQIFTNLMITIKNLCPLQERSLGLSSTIDWDATSTENAELKLFTVQYTMFIIGHMIYFASGCWDLLNHWDLPAMVGVTRGLIAASESTCKCEERAFPRKDLEIRTKVLCNTSDLEYFMKMPYCILSKIQTIRFSSCHAQSSDFVNSTSGFNECAEFVVELFGKGWSIEEFEAENKCFCSEHILSTIITGLQLNTNLRVLKFQQNLTVDHIISLSNLMRKNDCKIMELTLDQCGIEDEGAYELSKMLTVNTSLEILSITSENNAIGSNGTCAIAKAMQANDKLKSLNLSGIELQDVDACEIGKMLSVNQSLETLCLEHSFVGEEGAAALTRGLVANKTLQVLVLQCNTVGNVRSSPLAKALKVSEVSTTLTVSFDNQGALCEVEQYS